MDTTCLKQIGGASDLVPDVYEGGFVVWECTLDLLRYMLGAGAEVLKNSSSVLDLGCGSGLLGICAKRVCESGVTVHFQDYNIEVIDNFTVKNYSKNCASLSEHDTKFISGDWGDLADSLGKYDMILSAETIYSTKSQEKVLKILEEHLSEQGVALVAAKRHYFGVAGAGGVVDFQQLIDKSGRLECTVVWSYNSGLFRDILQISRISVS